LESVQEHLPEGDDAPPLPDYENHSDVSGRKCTSPSRMPAL
jgi:hypothetical protein